MSRLRIHTERHQVHTVGWLRAAVLGANDGIVSTASLIIGVAAAGGSQSATLTAGIAGLVAGAMSMAAGEYVSVSSQSDTENADLARERKELVDDPGAELHELAGIYEKRGVAPKLALEVARQMMAKDALAIHARDELGISETTAANPIQAALTSALTFAVGAAMPLLCALLAPAAVMGWIVATASLVFLAVLGGLGAWTGGASIAKGALRVTFWSVLAMAVTYLVGWFFGTTVG